MSAVPLISPLLDGFTLGNSLGEHDGVRCCPAIKEHSEKKYIVKIISIPATQVQMDALMLAGAYKDPADAMKYFEEIGQEVMKEAQFLTDISRLEGFLPYEGWQMEPIARKRLGYEVYLVGTYKRTLEKHVRRNPMTHLEAVNLGLDLCSALSVCRQAGALYVDLKPSNIFISEKKEYRIGDLGFVALNALKYTTLPDKYRSRYTPPELFDPMAPLNLTADTYALGMILYQLYNEGALPSPSTDSDETTPNPVNADYELAEIIMKAIHTDPEQRWKDPGEMGQALVSYMQRNVVNDVPITPYTPLDVEAQDVQIPKEDMPETSVVKTAASVTSLDSTDSGIPVQSESLPYETKEDSAETETQTADDIERDPPSENSADEGKAEAVEDDSIEVEMEQVAVSEPVAVESKTETENSMIKDSEEEVISDDLSRIFAKADDLISHEAPAGVILPEIPDQPDPFAFALEDSIEAEDLQTPFDPVMDTEAELPSRKEQRQANMFRSQERKRKVKRFFGRLFVLLVLAGLVLGGYLYYQTVYLQTIHSIAVEGSRDQLSVNINTSADESLLTVTCTDNYGNAKEKRVSGGQASFDGLLPNTMYRIEVSIDGFHKLIGQTSDIFTTDTTTNIISFSSITGAEDGSVVLNFTVDGEEPKNWAVRYFADGEDEKKETFEGHTVSIGGLTVGKIYTFTLDAGSNLSLSGKTSLDVMSSRLILAENLTATTTNGTDMTIHWTTPGDTIVESWNVRCYNDSGYDETLTVTENEVYLTGIDPAYSYNVEVTAAGMTQPARTSITANPLNITALNVDASDTSELTVSWEFAGNEPEGGWLLMYNVDGNSNFNVIKCENASAVISPKIPDADYHFTIQSVDGTSIFGNVHTYTCPSAEPYKDNAITADLIELNTIKTPDEKNWRFDNIGSRAYTDQFNVGDRISLILHAQSDFYLPGSELHILYVLRDAHGNVIPDSVTEEENRWKEIWYGGDYHYAELDIPNLPERSGTYTLHLYFDGFVVGQVTFTIND